MDSERTHCLAKLSTSQLTMSVITGVVYMHASPFEETESKYYLKSMSSRLVKHAENSSVLQPTATIGSFPSFTSKLFALQSANQCPRLCPHYVQLAFHNMPFFHPKDNGDAMSVLRFTYVYAAYIIGFITE